MCDTLATSVSIPWLGWKKQCTPLELVATRSGSKLRSSNQIVLHSKTIVFILFQICIFLIFAIWNKSVFYKIKEGYFLLWI